MLEKKYWDLENLKKNIFRGNYMRKYGIYYVFLVKKIRDSYWMLDVLIPILNTIKTYISLNPGTIFR